MDRIKELRKENDNLIKLINSTSDDINLLFTLMTDCIKNAKEIASFDNNPDEAFRVEFKNISDRIN